MAAGKMRRAPDGGVANAVSTVLEHQKFKKMLIFGLRSLSDLCDPSLQLYVENSVDALNRNVVPGILSAVENFGDDEYLVLCASAIMSAMSKGCVDYQDDPTVLNKLLKDGGVTTVEKILERDPQEEEVLDNCFKFLENLLGIRGLDRGSEFVPLLCNSLGKVKTFSVAFRLVLCLSYLTETGEACLAFPSNGSLEVLLNLTNNFSTGDANAAQLLLMVENCFKVLTSLSKVKLVQESNLEGVITLLESYKDSKLVLDRASDVIKSVIDTAKLKNALSVLERSQYDTADYKVAVNTLRCLSYISATEEMARGGVVPVLINLVRNSSPKLASDAGQIAEVVFGASRMLASISASTSEYGKDILSNNGLDVLVKALSEAGQHPRAVCGLSSALLQLLKFQPTSFSNAISVSLPLLYQLSEDESVSCSLVEFLSAASQYSELEMIFSQNKVMEILSTCCQYHTANLTYQFNVVSIMNKFSRFLENLKLVYEYGGLQGITFALDQNYKDLRFCLEVLNLVSVFVSTPSAEKYLTEGEYRVADVILELMLHYKDNNLVIDTSVGILDKLLVEKDVERYVKQVSAALPTTAEDPDATFKALAAVNGLHKIARLRPLLSKYSISPDLLKHLPEWLDVSKSGAWVSQRTNLTRAALACLAFSENVPETVQTISELACLTQVKKVIDLENPEDNFLLHCTTAVVSLSSLERNYSKDELVVIVDGIYRMLKRHQDVRQAVMALLDALSKLLLLDEKLFVEVMLDTGCLAGVVKYLNSVPMYLNLQLLGIGLIQKCTQVDPKVLDVLHQCNCFQLLRTVSRTHTKSKKLRSIVGSLISLLVPVDALETELQKLMDDLKDFMREKDAEGTHMCLVSVNQILVSKEAIKVGVKLDVLPTLVSSLGWTLTNSALFKGEGGEDVLTEALIEYAVLGNNLQNSRVGLVYSTKNEYARCFLRLYKEFTENEVAEDGTVLTLDGLVGLFKHDVANLDLAYNEDLLGKFASSLVKLLKFPNAVSALCRCLSALCASPGKIDRLLNNADFAKFCNHLVSNLEYARVQVDAVTFALSALDELLAGKYKPLLDFFDNNTPIVLNLYALLEQFYKQPDMVSQACRLLSYFDKKLLLSRAKDLRKLLEVVSSALAANKSDADCAVAILGLLVQVIGDDTLKTFKNTSIVDNISSVMLLHFENEAVTKLGGELFTFLGVECQISALMKNTIQTVEAKEENMGQKVDKHCLLLAMYLSSTLKDRAQALKHTEQFLASLNQCLSFLADNSNLVASTCCVSRKLCDGAFDDQEDPFGAWAVANSANLGTICSLVKAEYGYSNAKFLVHAFRVFTSCLHNGYTTEAMLAEGSSLMVRTVQVLERYSENSELISNVVEFLLYLSRSAGESTSGADVIVDNVNSIPQLLTKVMVDNKSNESAVVNGLKVLTKLVSHTKKLDKKQVADSLDACERLCKVEKTTTAPVNSDGEDKVTWFFKYFNSALANGYLSDAYMNLDRISKMVLLLEATGLENLKAVPYALFVFNAAVADLLSSLERLGGVRGLIELFEKMLHSKTPLTKEELMDLLLGLGQSCSRDAIKATLVFKDLFPTLLNLNRELLTNDPEVVELLLQTLVGACNTKGVGGILNSVESLTTYLQSVKNVHPKLVEQLLALIKKDLPKKKTCETVYKDLLERATGGKQGAEETMDYTKVDLSDALLMEEYKFVLNSMKKYNAKVQKGGDPECLDYGFAFKCVDLLTKLGSNCALVAKSDLSALLVQALATQTDLLLADSILPAICSCCKFKETLLSLAGERQLVSTVDAFLVKAYQRRLVTTGTPEDKLDLAYENVLFNTMLLIDLTAVNRKVYLKSNVIPSLMDVWSLSDEGKFSSNKILRQVFRSLRKVVSEENVQLMIKCKLVARVNKVFSELTTKDKKSGTVAISSSKEATIPDALFLIGSMAIILEIKEEICNAMLLEKIVDLLQRYVKTGSSSAVVTNCCLALANICVDYKPAADKFAALKGPQLNFEVFVNFKSSFEVINGSSILLCNLLYKNDKMKEIYGRNGTPAALVECLLNFVGSTDATSLRCVESLFKAISNLALYAKNVQYFVQANVESAFKQWLHKVTHTQNYDLSLVKVGLNCLSNLVVENNPEFLKRFAVFMEDLVLAMNLELSDPKVVFLLLDISNNLCRSKDNCVRFVDLEGVYASVRNLRRLNYDLEVLVTGIHLYGHLAFGNGTTKLLEVDIFSLLLEIVEHGSEMNDVLISSLRCLRRLMQSPEMVYLLCSQDGLDTVIRCSVRMKDHSSVLVESIRLLLGMLYYTDPYTNSAGRGPLKAHVQDDESTGIGSDSDVDMGWENIGLSGPTIIEIIKFSCYVATLETCVKMSRLQSSVVSICAYFMSCGLCGEELALNGFPAILENFVGSFCHGNPSLSLLAVTALEASLNYSPDLRSSVITKQVLKRYRDLSQVLSDKGLKAKCVSLLDQINSNANTAAVHLDLALTDWNVDPYPNGVHDLPDNLKEMLRSGGKFQLATTLPTEKKSKRNESHTWKASQDLSTLEWVNDATADRNKIAFMRVRNIARGLKHESLVNASVRDRKVTHLNSMVLFGSATEDHPQGFTLPMIFKTNKEREIVAEAFIQWRDAASYN